MTTFAFRHAAASFALAVIIATGLAACGPAQPPSGPTATQDTPAIAAVRALYEVYNKASIGPRGQEVDWSAMRSTKLAARFAALPAKQLASEEPILDFDPVVAGQDWAITELQLSEKDGGAANRKVVTATFKNSEEPRTVMFDMVEDGGAWKVDNIRAPAPFDYDVLAIFEAAGVN
jgi:hypothetical protein